jgi:hypothetical protein
MNSYQQPAETIDVDDLNGRLYRAIREGLVEMVQAGPEPLYAATERGLAVGRVRCMARDWDPETLSVTEMLCLIAYDVVLES